MTKYLLIVDYNPGVVDTPMTEWAPDEIKAHMDYYGALHDELRANGELLANHALTGPEQARTVVGDGRSAPVVTDGPYAEFKEMLAGYELVDVESEERVIEIAAKLSAVPGPGGVPLQQPIRVRRLMGPADFTDLHPDL
ncbi:YciI family protein [Hamadaea tsunoensis]|uniref:YciI family protein n=1 Tax=Hamadaea tsunoensis TaxID=53368 RepID=UPI000416B1E1|nr:YciI family protein [Hamadaea tsunoensis]